MKRFNSNTFETLFKQRNPDQTARVENNPTGMLSVLACKIPWFHQHGG